MYYPSEIKKYFLPSQPTVNENTKHIEYSEFRPAKELNNYIYCYWQLKNTSPLLDQFNYRVVADGCIDVFFEVENSVESFVMGLSTSPVTFALAESFHYFGVRFFPAAFAQLFNIDVSQITNQYIKLSDVLPHFSLAIQEATPRKHSIEEIQMSFDSYLGSILHKATPDYDARFYDALIQILRSRGNHPIQSLSTGIGTRQLRRLFKQYVGESPKVFSKIVRFQHFLQSKPSRQSLRQNKEFFDAGYFDQAHFIREFKSFYGLTPKQALD